MRGFRVVLVPLLALLSLQAAAADEEGESINPDLGPEDPGFVPNDGELDSDVSPQKKPTGNYHIIKDKGVYVLNRDTFAHFVMDRKIVLVEFYAPWCGHCKSLDPHYKRAAATLEAEGIPLAKVDGTKEGELAKEFMIQGYPTLILFRDGMKQETYSGPRTHDGIVGYMRKMNDPNWTPPPSAVVELTADDFTPSLKEEKLALVMFYAPWCKHCKQLLPEYEGAAQALKELNIPLFKVDGTREKELADQYQVAGWPEIKMFRKGRLYTYKGPREQDNIVEYMKQQASAPSEEKNSKLGITNNMDRLDITVVGFFNGKTDLYDEFMVAANEMRGTFRFLHTIDPAVAEEFKVPAETVSVYVPEIYHSPYENSTFHLSKKSATYKEILQFIKKNSVPLVSQRTKHNNFKFTERPMIVVYFDVNYDYQYVKDTQYVRKMILQVAKNFVGSNLKFAMSNEDEYEDEIKSLGFTDSGNAINMAAFTEKQKFPLHTDDDEFSAEMLSQFVEDLRTGGIKPYMKSAPVPKKQTGNVKHVVADNYDVEIHKVKKDAVIFFHAPWCGHCKEFDPVYKKLAKKMKATNENIVFGKYDGVANDVPYMFPQLKGFPSIFFLSAYEKYDPILYQGERNYKDIKEWINRHSSIFLTEEERTGQIAEVDEEIESFTSENINTDKKPEEATSEEGSKKDEL